MAAEFVQRGRTFVEQGQLQEAVRVCRLGLLANPGEIEGRLVLGTALMALARYDEVLAEMHSALAMESVNPSALALKGEALLRKGEFVQAQVVLEQAEKVALGDPYVEALQAEAAVAAANAPAPYETIDIDPELEGVEISNEQARAPALKPLAPTVEVLSLSDSGIELLDEDLLQEATPTPAPDNLFDDMMTREAPRGLVERLDSRDLAEIEQPFEDNWGVHGTEDLSESDLLPGAPIGLPGRPETVGTLFPDDESGVSGLELVASPHAVHQAQGENPSAGANVPRAMTADMDLIRGGFQYGQPQPARPARAPRPVSTASQAPVEPRRNEPTQGAPKRKRKVPVLVWLVLLLTTVAGGAFAGLKFREQRIAGQIQEARAKARTLAARDNYQGHKQARDLYGRINTLEKDDSSRSALARSEAALAAEFGHSPDRAMALLSEVSDKGELDALVAAAYIALANGSHVAAAEKAALIVKGHVSEAIGHYLMGRAKILSEDPEAALVSLGKAVELGASPLTYVAQARAKALQGHYAEALSAVAKAGEEDNSNAAAQIWQARILLQSGALPKNPSDPDDALGVLIERSQGRDLKADSISPAQGAWAGLVLAEIKLHRGDNQGANKALAEASVNRPSNWLFSEMLSDVLIGLGKNKEAKLEATRASEMWPSRAKPRIVMALVALLDGDPEGAIKILADLEEMDSLAEALIVRGRANLMLGLLDQAVLDLDKALVMRSRDRAAVIARAQVDILRGDAKSAISRLEPMFDRTAGPDLAIAYACALRTHGKPGQARNVLEPLVGAGGSVPALIELAALERSEGNFEEARGVFQRAIALDPQSQEARLGSALLDIEDGKVGDGRKVLDQLVAEGTKNGQILVEAARAQIWTGSSDSAKVLLERTSKSSSWLNWKVAREGGRIDLRRQKLGAAIGNFLRAQSLRPTDADTRLLLMEAYFQARNTKGSDNALQDITKSFADTPTRQMAVGIHFLLQGRALEAATSFADARSRLLSMKASRLELAEVAYWLGRSYEVSGDLKEAASWLQKGVDLNDSHAAAYFWLGQVQLQDGQTKKMVDSYKKAMAIDPQFNPMAWYFLGSQYAAEGKKDLAVKALKSFLEFYPEDSGSLVTEAKSLLEQNR